MRDPEIIIAGRPWRVPLFAPRQNRIVIPAILRMGPVADSYNDLLDIAFAALTRAYPALDRDEFEELPIPTWELLDALPVISKQTGMLKKGEKKSSTRSEPPDWDAIIAQFCNFLPGTTPDYWEDALTWPRYEAMMEEWRLRPPVALLVAGYLQFKPRAKPMTDEESILEFLRLFPTGEMRAN